MWACAAHRISTVRASTCLTDMPDMTGKWLTQLLRLNPHHQCVCVCVCVRWTEREINSTLFLTLLVSSFLRHAWSIFHPLTLHSVCLFLLPSFLLPASISLFIPTGFCYLITLSQYQITEEEHTRSVSVCVRGREREHGAAFGAMSTSAHIYLFFHVTHLKTYDVWTIPE